MSRPEDFREDVYLAEGYHADALRSELGGHGDTQRTPVERDLVREAFRESAGREPLHRELTRELGRDLGRETGRDLGTRESLDRGLDRSLDRSLDRQPLNQPQGREIGGRVIGSPLAGSPLPSRAGGPTQDAHKTASPPGRALSNVTPSAPAEDSSAMQRAMGLLKSAAPFVAKLLPLLDGNVTTAVSNLFAPRPHAPAPPVDLTPVHNQLTEMQLQQNDLRSTVQEQTTSLKRVEDQLELVREATDRNTLEQQEFIEDLKAVGHKVSLIAVGLSILLVLSVVMNLVLYMYIKRVLP